MKTKQITAFAFALVVFAFNTNIVMAAEKKEKHCLIFTYDENQQHVCTEWIWVENQVDDLKDPDQADNERDVADSGNEDSTSAASAGDQ